MDRFDYSSLIKDDTDYLRQSAARGRQLLALITPAVIELGGIVAEARDRIPHGYFGSWCTDALGIDRRTALNYLNLAKLAKTHDRERIEKLSLTAAHHIAAPSTPAAAVAQVLDRVAAGNIPTAAEVKDLIHETRRVEASRGADQVLEDEVEVLPGLLTEALDASCLTRLKVFLLAASSQAIREFCSNLEVSIPIASTAQNNRTNQWTLTS
jgi:hypothetical protein